MSLPSSPPSGYEARLQTGEIALNNGDFITALSQFDEAFKCAENDEQAARALQWRGITYRLSGKYVDAIDSLEEALARVDERSLQAGLINRDLGMVYVDLVQRYKDNGDSSTARAARLHLENSQTILREVGLSIEEAATLGFIGRLHYIIGEKLPAAVAMKRADQILKKSDNPAYELNNLIWLMRVVPRSERVELNRRALKLVQETGQTRRLKELKLLMLGGDRLYRLARRFASFRERRGR